MIDIMLFLALMARDQLWVEVGHRLQPAKGRLHPEVSRYSRISESDYSIHTGGLAAHIDKKKSVQVDPGLPTSRPLGRL